MERRTLKRAWKAFTTELWRRRSYRSNPSKKQIEKYHRLIEQRDRPEIHDVTEQCGAQRPNQKAAFGYVAIRGAPRDRYRAKTGPQNQAEEDHERQASPDSHLQEMVGNVGLKFVRVDARRHPVPRV